MERTTLNKNQTELYGAVAEFLCSSRTIFDIQGGPGTGKTYFLRSLVEDNPFLNFKLVAFTNTAVKELKNAVGFHRNASYDTIAGLLGWKPNTNEKEISFDRWQIGDLRCNSDDILIIDEKSMVSEETLKEIKAKLYGRKLILIGDKLQLPPVNEKALSFNPDFELTEQVRNLNNPYVEKFKAFAEIEHKTGIIYPYDFKDEIAKSVDFQDLIGQFELGMDRVITYTNEVKDYYNALIRKAFSMNDFEDYGWGDYIIFNNKYSSTLGVYHNGETKKVLSARRYIHKLGFNDKLFLPNWIRGEEFQYYEIQFDDGKAIALCSSERERFWELLDKVAQNVKDKKGLNWKTYHSIKALFADISYAYSVTSHKSQGQTIRNTYFCVEDFIGRPIKSAYVGVSRNKEQIYFIY